MKVRNNCDKIWLETCEKEVLLQDWLKGSNSVGVGLCSAIDCSKPAEFGGCVKITDADADVDEKDWLNLQSSHPEAYYLIPLCEDCLKRFGEEYEVKKGTHPVRTDRVFCEPIREGCTH